MIFTGKYILQLQLNAEKIKIQEPGSLFELNSLMNRTNASQCMIDDRICKLAQ